MPDAVYDVKTLSPFSLPSVATAVLILEDGSIFYGSGFGAEATNVGEITDHDWFVATLLFVLVCCCCTLYVVVCCWSLLVVVLILVLVLVVVNVIVF